MGDDRRTVYVTRWQAVRLALVGEERLANSDVKTITTFWRFPMLIFVPTLILSQTLPAAQAVVAIVVCFAISLLISAFLIDKSVVGQQFRYEVATKIGALKKALADERRRLDRYEAAWLDARVWNRIDQESIRKLVREQRQRVAEEEAEIERIEWLAEARVVIGRPKKMRDIVRDAHLTRRQVEEALTRRAVAADEVSARARASAEELDALVARVRTESDVRV